MSKSETGGAAPDAGGGEDLPRASPLRAGILRLAGPLVVSFTFRAAFQWVDTVYAAQIEGKEDASLAAIGLTLPFEFMMIACWVGTSNGLTSRLAAAMGARQGARMEQLKRATRRIIVCLCGLFLLLSGGIWFAAEHVGLEPVLAQQFKIYGSVLMGGSAITAFWSILPDSIVKAHHDTRSTMWAGILSGSTNVVLNTLFLFAFHWGIFGIALATVLGRLAGLAYALGAAGRHERRRSREGGYDAPGVDRRPVRAILTIAVPAAIGFILMALESTAVNGLLANSSRPTSSLAAWSLFDRAVRFLCMPVIASGVAMLPLAARLWGARDLGSIRAELRTVLLAFLAYVLLLVLPLTLFAGPWVAAALADAEETRRFAEIGFSLVAVAVLAMGPMFVLRSLFEGIQRPLPGLVAGLVRTTVFVIPLTYAGMQVAARMGRTEILGAFVGFVLGLALASGLLALWARRALGMPLRPPAA